MDFGNIIFIGVVAIAVISNIVKAAKKVQKPQAKPLVGRPLQEVVVVQQQQKQQQQQPANPVPRRNNKPKSAQSIAVPPFVEGERQLKEVELQLLDAEIDRNKYDFSNREEIRKGIIFSEIFNRKH